MASCGILISGFLFIYLFFRCLTNSDRDTADLVQDFMLYFKIVKCTFLQNFLPFGAKEYFLQK